MRLLRTGPSTESFRIVRLPLFSALLILSFAAIVSRLFFLQIISHDRFRALADSQHLTTLDVAAHRGAILARDRTNESAVERYPLAMNKTFYEIYLNPSEITRPINVAELLAETLDVDYETMLKRAQKIDDGYEPVVPRATQEQFDVLKASGLAGVYGRSHTWRYYPDKGVGSHILGFFGTQGALQRGAYGIEGFWENSLAGDDTEVVVARDRRGTVIPESSAYFSEGADGASILLTIDRTIQYEACTRLAQTVERFAADKGSVIIMESATGRILAMCNEPAFNPNEYNKVSDITVYNNDAVFEAYEPGSVFKPISMAIAIDQGVVSPSTAYDDTGEVKISGRTIRNFDKKAHGRRTMTEVLQESLNLGIIFATRNVKNSVFYDYVKKFGFGETYGIETSQESAGNLGELSSGQDIYKATVSFGQGITVTPLQMIAAINVIANDGMLVKPYIVEEIIGPDGAQISTTQPKDLRRVIRSDTAQTVAAMLVRVLEEGYDDKAQVAGYYLGGKTGTAQIAEKGSYGNKTNHTFVGFGPVGDSKFTILIKMHNVKNVGFAADSTTPLFHDIAEFLLHYYRIRPTR